MEKCQVSPFVKEGLNISHDSLAEGNQLLKRHKCYSEQKRTIHISTQLLNVENR